MIRVLVVDDSALMRKILSQILQAEGVFDVVGTAADGEEALRCVEELRPDVVTMDIHMPYMDGHEATLRIMQEHPTPIVIISSSYDSNDVEKAMWALSSGALAAVEKPVAAGHPRYEHMVAELTRTVRLMSEIKVIRRQPTPARVAAPDASAMPRREGKARIIAIGASTGGPPVLRSLFEGLPADLGVPVVLVQHIAEGFTRGLAEWLDASCPLLVNVATSGEHLAPGRVYIAPSGSHMSIDGDRRVVLLDAPPEYGVRPSVSHLFRSVASAFKDESVGVLLSGMGRDGALELKMLRDAGAVTIAQDKETSVIHGMPGEAISLGAATYVLPPEEILRMLPTLVNPWAVLR
jgi:two-component system chemotaxis response regulator CheB